jgi:hypothetical protein
MIRDALFSFQSFTGRSKPKLLRGEELVLREKKRVFSKFKDYILISTWAPGLISVYKHVAI